MAEIPQMGVRTTKWGVIGFSEAYPRGASKFYAEKKRIFRPRPFVMFVATDRSKMINQNFESFGGKLLYVPVIDLAPFTKKNWIFSNSIQIQYNSEFIQKFTQALQNNPRCVPWYLDDIIQEKKFEKNVCNGPEKSIISKFPQKLV